MDVSAASAAMTFDINHPQIQDLLSELPGSHVWSQGESDGWQGIALEIDGVKRLEVESDDSTALVYVFRHDGGLHRTWTILSDDCDDLHLVALAEGLIELGILQDESEPGPVSAAKSAYQALLSMADDTGYLPLDRWYPTRDIHADIDGFCLSGQYGDVIAEAYSPENQDKGGEWRIELTLPIDKGDESRTFHADYYPDACTSIGVQVVMLYDICRIIQAVELCLSKNPESTWQDILRFIEDYSSVQLASEYGCDCNDCKEWNA